MSLHLFCVAGAVVAFIIGAIDARHSTQLISLALAFLTLALYVVR